MAAETQAGRVSWRAVVCVLAAGALTDFADASGPLRSIAEISAQPPAELTARQPVVIRGVVTLADPLVIQDGEHAICLAAAAASPEDAGATSTQPMDPPPPLGTELEVSGFFDPGARAPTVAVESIRQLGMRPLPEPAPLDPAQFFAGSFPWRRIKAAGVVQAVLDNPEGWSLIVESSSRRFRVVIGKSVMPTRPDRLIDADVEVVGVNYLLYNNRSEFIAPRLRVASFDDIRTGPSPRLEPFELPVVPLGAIARIHLQPPKGHRVRTTGVVSFAVPGAFYVQEGAGGVRIDLAPDPGTQQVFRAGDQVDVAGFLDVSSGIGSLAWAVARTISSGPAPAAVPIQPCDVLRINDASYRSEQQAAPGNYEGCLIRCAGRIEAVNISSAGTVLTLFEQGSPFTATLADGGSTAASRFVPGSDVELTGIVRTLRSLERVGDLFRHTLAPFHVEVLVRDAADIRVVRLPPWWTPWRLGVAAATAAALAIASFAWVTVLRREVGRQTSRALAEEAARVKAAMDYEITLRERNRLAANLHDTLLQTLGGIGFQLDACEGSRGRDEADAKMHFDVARRMVNHATTELHSSVWAMRSLPIRDRTFPEALRTLADRVAEGHAALVDVRTTGDLDHVPEFVAGHVLLIIQEALYNALRHGRPNRVDIRVHGDASTSAVDILVHDDGRGFGTGALPGMDQGHFGVQGMRERAERLGGWLEIESADGQGTTVHARVVGHEREEAGDMAELPRRLKRLDSPAHME